MSIISAYTVIKALCNIFKIIIYKNPNDIKGRKIKNI